MHCEEAGVLLTDFLEEKLDPKTREIMADHVAHCSNCKQDLAQLQQWQTMSRRWQDDKMPEWSRTQFAVPPSAKPHWLNWLSLATSTLAIVLVTSQLSVQSDDKGLHLSFGKPAQQGLSETQLDERLMTFAKVQQTKLENRFMELELAQAEKDKRLLSAALNISREQTRDGYEQLVGYWQDVRQQDISNNQHALRRLYSAQQTEFKTLKASIRQTTVPEEL